MRIPAIRVRQWLSAWDGYHYDEASRQRKPPRFFYVCSMSAWLLKRLSGVRRREASGPRQADIGIQRSHEKQRSQTIRRFVEAGYPWATLNTQQKHRFPELRKPGWLPTAVVANLVGPNTDRYGIKADPRDLITLDQPGGDFVHLVLPHGSENTTWKPSKGRLHPIEIIDGQHRLHAFEDKKPEGDFELPVVFFSDLDISWQAYLFWTINITPKRINPSMAYDLYPLLRTADWLETVEGPMAYRETRAQELTEAMWSHPESPWRERIGMLGRERGKVTQAAFVRSLTISFVRGWSGSRRTGIGGFFGTGHALERSDVLGWNRAQQAAYLIALWQSLRDAIANSAADWVAFLRELPPETYAPQGQDAAFAGRFSILASDQGVRGFLQVCNDISYHNRHEVPFHEWQRPTTSAEATDHLEVSLALQELRNDQHLNSFVVRLTQEVSRFDWRSAVAPGLPSDAEQFQSRYRSGSGYKQVRSQLLRVLSNCDTPDIARSALAVAEALGYDREWL